MMLKLSVEAWLAERLAQMIVELAKTSVKIAALPGEATEVLRKTVVKVVKMAEVSVETFEVLAAIALEVVKLVALMV